MKKSWHITTKLATYLIHNVIGSRRGVIDSFQPGDVDHIKCTLFYAIQYFMDKMELILTQHYEDFLLSTTYLLSYEYRVVDFNLDDFFLSFPLHKSLNYLTVMKKLTDVRAML